MIARKPLFVLCIILLLMMFTCKKNNNNEKHPGPPLTVYKFSKGKDYSNNVYVLLDSQRNNIIGYPSYGDVEYTTILDYYKGYYLGGGFYGIYTAFLNITIDEFQYIDDTITEQGFYGHIIDKNPFEEYFVDEEYYLGNDCPQCVQLDTTWVTYDTVKFHRLVDMNELELYLKKKI